MGFVSNFMILKEWPKVSAVRTLIKYAKMHLDRDWYCDATYGAHTLRKCLFVSGAPLKQTHS
jgi:hypothetical protein